MQSKSNSPSIIMRIKIPKSLDRNIDKDSKHQIILQRINWKIPKLMAAFHNRK